VASGTIVLPGGNLSLPQGQEGAIIAAVSATTLTVVASQLFDINNPNFATAQAALDAMAAYVASTPAVQSTSNYVVGVAATGTRHRRLLYEENFHPSAGLEVDMYPSQVGACVRDCACHVPCVLYAR
jgi:hypothetical protein